MFTTAYCSNLSKEELSKLKAGDIVEGEDGKRYRVRKSMLPKQSVTGPHGIGKIEVKNKFIDHF
jgi:hypothetical protein